MCPSASSSRRQKTASGCQFTWSAWSTIVAFACHSSSTRGTSAVFVKAGRQETSAV